MKLRFAIVATLLSVVGLGACRDPLELEARIETTIDTLSVFAISGTPPGYPNALTITGRQTLPISAFGGFDVAFDIDDSNRAVVHAARRVISTGGFVPTVGLQIVPGTFETVMAAPLTGYKVDSSVVVSEGQVVVLEAQHNGTGDLCTFAISPNVYAKISIDTVFAATRTIKFRLGTDLNCGFRSFAPGIPTS
ncbi:MAG TPA: hypothetical protein VNO75_04265 [Gemmatimonadaceae bacterium]|nr:hypothetical protein [Gemmatimonadaceae bacterium]